MAAESTRWQVVIRKIGGLTSIRAMGVWGTASTAALIAGILLAEARHPQFSLLSHYISQLGTLNNPGRHFFGAGVITAGLLLIPFALGLGRLIDNAHGRRASRYLLLVGAAMSLVGCFPVHQPVAHFACAGVLFVAAMFVEGYVAFGLRSLAARSPSPRALRLASRLTLTIVAFQIACAIAGAIYSALTLRNIELTSGARLLKEITKRQQIVFGSGWPPINPVALSEWAFFVVGMGLILLAGLLGAVRGEPIGGDS